MLTLSIQKYSSRHYPNMLLTKYRSRTPLSFVISSHFLLLLLLLNASMMVQSFSPHAPSRVRSIQLRSTGDDNDASSSSSSSSSTKERSPKLIVFDLDGCLWKPEMYELSWYGKGSPFQPDGKGNMISAGGDKVYLLGNVRSILSDLYKSQSAAPLVGISSRTDEPDWARELLQKFVLEDGETPMAAVFGNDNNNDLLLIEISYDSKTSHFERLAARTGIALEDMVFFDNERGNCIQVAKLGVTVAHVPSGVTSKSYQAALNAFPTTSGQVANLDI